MHFTTLYYIEALPSLSLIGHCTLCISRFYVYMILQLQSHIYTYMNNIWLWCGVCCNKQRQHICILFTNMAVIQMHIYLLRVLYIG